ncbi:hypothetical protein JG687_00004959 [Phytophthora cactorum]|uniref:Uncharacterized protein n=4 Tax=Phytophthora TaxID=4783 RepID=A0A8T1UNK0_9STRA|nr:hypothetical protein JG687_00004959 [Phytophthora cactorum]
MKTFAIIAAFAYVAALVAAEEPAVKDAATTEAEPTQIDAAAEAAAPENQEWDGGYRGGYGGGGYGGYRRRWGGYGGGYGHRGYGLLQSTSTSIYPGYNMKMSIASIAVALVYFLSFVTATHQPGTMMTSDQDDQTMVMTSGLRGGGASVGVVTNKIDAKNNNVLVSNSKITVSKDDRVQLAQTIKEMLTNNPEAGAASDMSTEDLFGLLSRVATTPGVLSNAAGILSAARSGNTGALAGHVVGLLGAAIPAALPTPAPAPVSPVVAPVMTPAAPMIPMAPIYATAAPVAALPSTSA